MAADLSQRHELVGDLFEFPASAEQWQSYCLTEQQIASYKEQGYVAGVRILTDEQVEKLRGELQEFFNPRHAGASCGMSTIPMSRPIQAEFSSTRWAPGGSGPPFMTYSGIQPSRCPPVSCSRVPFASGMISYSASPLDTGAWWLGTRTIPIGRVPSRWLISLAGLGWTIVTATTAAFSTFRAAITGIYCPSRDLPEI